VKSFIIDVFHFASWFPFSRWLWFPLLSTWVHVLVPKPPNCPYLLSSWVKINGFINKWLFYFIWKAFYPCFLTLSLSPLWFNQSVPSYVSTCFVMKREKEENFTCFFLWTAIWEVAILLTYLWAYVFMLEFFACVVSFSCCVICSFMWKQLGLSYIWSLLVLAGSISEEGLWGKCPCIVLIRSRPCSVSPNTC